MANNIDSKEKFFQYLQEFFGITVTAIICYVIYRYGKGNDNACFAITLGAVAYLLLCFHKVVFKNVRKGMTQKILSGLMIIAFSNELYDYNKMIAAFPVLKNVTPLHGVILLLGAVFAVLVTIKVIIYFYENSDTNSNSDGKTITGKSSGGNTVTPSSSTVTKGTEPVYTVPTHKTKDINVWPLLYLIFLVIIVGVLVVLFTVLYAKGLLKQNFDFVGIVSFLAKYAGSIVMFLLAVVIVLVVFIELIRMIIVRLKAITSALKAESQSESGPLYLLSIIIDFLVCYFTYKSTGIDMESFIGFVNDGKYLALPLTVLFVGVAFVIFLRLTHATLVLLVDMKPEKVKEFLTRVNDKAKITNRLAEIIQHIIDIILNSVITALKFVKFIPNFFGIIYSFVLEDEEDFEFDEENGKSNGDHSENGNNKKKKSQRTGATIVRVAAFAFAVVSWYATAEGLSLYVFGPGWQSICISFGIQAILFVLNLKLPAYYARIGDNAVDREKKKYWFGSKKGQEKNKYKATRHQKALVVFYIVALFSSSFFSFIYICNHVVYDHQSGYIDDNTIISSEYRAILNDTDDYIKEDTKAMQILASKLLGQLKEAYPVHSDGNESLESLKDKETDALQEYNNAYLEYQHAEDVVEVALAAMTGYEKSRNNTTYHGRQDAWEKKYEEAKKEYEAAEAILKQKINEYKTAEETHRDAETAVKNYRKSQDTVIAEFLLEMLKPTPNPNALETDINALNAMIVELGESGDFISNYSDLVGKTQTLTVVVKDYIDLVDAVSAKTDNSIEYMLKHVMDDVVVPVPSMDSFADDIVIWRKSWENKLDTLENVIQHLPKFSENEKAYLEDGIIDVNLLTEYVANEKMNQIDELRRSKISDINVIEKTTSLLMGKYSITAWFSFGLAVLFDAMSLLAGLFLFWIQKKKKES